MHESKYARKRRLQEKGVYPRFGQLEEKAIPAKIIIPKPLQITTSIKKIYIPDRIKFQCSKAPITGFINFSMRDENPKIHIDIVRRPEERHKKRIYYFSILNIDDQVSYAIGKQNHMGERERLIIENIFHNFYKHEEIIKSRNTQQELYTIEEGINRNKNLIEKYLETKLT